MGTNSLQNVNNNRVNIKSKGIDVISNILANTAVEIAGKRLNELIDTSQCQRSSFIIVRESDEGFDNANRILYKLDKMAFISHQKPTPETDVVPVLQPNSSYTIKKKNVRIHVQMIREENTTKYYDQILTISFRGKNAAAYRNLIAGKIISNTVPGKLQIYNIYGSTYLIPESTFKDVIAPRDIREKIVLGLYNWKKSKSWYDKNHIVHKIGVLLYGNPGTGKSTIAKAIASMFHAKIIVVDVVNVKETINYIGWVRKRTNSALVCIIEDVDFIFQKRVVNNAGEENTTLMTTDKSEKISEDSNESQRQLLQLLDGIYAYDDVIYVATTNHIESLDPALIRPGRFDIQVELKYFEKEAALALTKRMGYSKEVLDDINPSYPVQPAELQAKIMEYRANHMN